MAIGAGGLLSAGCSGPLGRLSRPGLAMLVSVSSWGAAIAGFAAVQGLASTLLFLALAGGADTVTVVLRGTIVQAATPDALRGRVTATEYVVGACGGELGNLEAGAVGSLTSPAISAASGGLATIAVALALAVVLPGFARHRAGGERPDLGNGAAALGDVAGVVVGEEQEAAHHGGHG
jgi:hypothetical protein